MSIPENSEIILEEQDAPSEPVKAACGFVERATEANLEDHFRFRSAVEGVLLEALEVIDETRLRAFCQSYADRWDDIADFGWFQFGEHGYVIHPNFDGNDRVLAHVNELSELANMTPFRVWLAILECKPLEPK